MTGSSPRLGAPRRGFTVVELVIALAMGLVILASASAFAVITWRHSAEMQMREGVSRNARFVGMVLERDLQHTGVAFSSMANFGSLAARNDTLAVLSVPFEPLEAPPYRLNPPVGSDPILPPGGTCGARCLDLLSPQPGDPVELKAGDLARLQVDGVRRLILIQTVSPVAGGAVITFAPAAELMLRPASLSGGLLLRSTGTFVQKLTPIVYWLESGTLMRAESFNPDGTLHGHVIAEGVVEWEVRLIFIDGRELPEADPFDADPANNYDDIVGVRIRMVLESERNDPRVRHGEPVRREHEWWFAPRNLAYERNR
jgi:prepilin-type N-terminal cleavage/methylation domain-containing protein